MKSRIHTGLTALLAGCALLVLLAAAQGPNVRVAVVNPDRIQDDSKRIHEQMVQASQASRTLQDKVKAAQQDYNQALAEYNSQKSVVDASVNQARSEALNQKLQAINLLSQQLNDELNKAATEKLAPIRDRVSKAITEVARDGGIDVVISSGSAIYFTPQADITDAVIARLDGVPQ